MIRASSRENLSSGVSDQIRHKWDCTVKEDGQRFEISEIGREEIVLFMQRKQRSRSAAWYGAFVFAYAKSRFSHGAAQ